MTKEEAVALLERYSNYDGMGIPNLAGCKEAMRVAVDALKEAYPELMESEGERIRKEIVGVIQRHYPNTPESYRWIAYLEKQKENPKTSNSIPSDCTSNAKCEDRWHKVEDSLPDNGREVLAKDKLGNTLLARYDGEGWDVSVYDDEDYRCHNGISKWCEIPSEKQKEQKPWKVGANAYFTPEHKPVEYLSKRKVYDIMNKLTELSTSDLIPIESEEYVKIHEITSDVRDLLNYPIEQKQEWSKEDRDILLQTAAILKANFDSDEKFEDCDYDCETLAGKLLEMRYRISPSWKPSEEQMEALNALNLHGDLSYVGQQNQLISLYQDLKKL